jgi:hypothetical protein
MDIGQYDELEKYAHRLLCASSQESEGPKRHLNKATAQCPESVQPSRLTRNGDSTLRHSPNTATKSGQIQGFGSESLQKS